VPTASATANIGFLALKLEGHGTGQARAPPPSTPSGGPTDRLLSVAADIRLKNPRVAPGDPLANRIDVGVLINALRDGKFFYNAGDAGGGSDDHPSTGIISGTLPGDFGADLTLTPDGALVGLADDLNVHLAISGESTDWLSSGTPAC